MYGIHEFQTYVHIYFKTYTKTTFADEVTKSMHFEVSLIVMVMCCILHSDILPFGQIWYFSTHGPNCFCCLLHLKLNSFLRLLIQDDKHEKIYKIIKLKS